MCGIWAVFGSKGDISAQCHAAHMIKHRGPDGFRIESIPNFSNICFGFYRLAINDLLNGMQPLRVEKYPNIFLIYNGEIYNHQMLKEEYGYHCSTRCDGEIIIHLYAQGGIEFATKQLDGVFAYCLLDTNRRKCYLGRDTYGVKPMLKIYKDIGFLAVCSELKGLTAISNEHVEHFPPGHIESYLIDSDGNAKFEEKIKFHKIGQCPAFKSLSQIKDLNEKEENIRNLLEDAVEKRMMAERRIGCLLSGGLDSSLVASLLVKKARELNLSYCIQTFSIGMKGSPDLMAARKVATYLQTEHHEVLMTAKEGCAAIEDVIYHLESYAVHIVRNAVAQFLLCKYIRKNTDATVLLSGEGADEIAQGYSYFLTAPTPKDADIESKRRCASLYWIDFLRLDRSTAAWGLEARVPFLDYTFSHYYLSLPKSVRQPQNEVEKYTLRSAFNNTDQLPRDILWRPKVEYSDGLSTNAKSWIDYLQEFIHKQRKSKQQVNITSVEIKYGRKEKKVAKPRKGGLTSIEKERPVHEILRQPLVAAPFVKATLESLENIDESHPFELIYLYQNRVVGSNLSVKQTKMP